MATHWNTIDDGNPPFIPTGLRHTEEFTEHWSLAGNENKQQLILNTGIY